jgi:hypothetical protein
MHTKSLLGATAVLLAACAGSGTSVNRTYEPSCCSAEGHAVATQHRVAGITNRRFTHAELWKSLEDDLQSDALTVATVGRSMLGRPIRAVSFGRGPTTVLLWSQMHGNESTATMALADLIAWFASDTPAQAALRERLESRLRIVMIPMLNPDGSELFQRENAVGIDINRDARSLATPEARTLKSLRDSIKPAFGFNLHDQNARTLTGSNGNQVAIALLAPAADEERSYGPVRATARQVASVIAAVLRKEIPGRLARYNDTHEPRAFGDLMQQWGTSTVLIESGAMPDDPEKQKLRTLNVVAILSALDAMATRSWENADIAAYEGIPTNSRSAVDLLLKGGSLVLPGLPPTRADVAINYEESVAKLDARVTDVGDLVRVIALDTLDVSGLFLHPSPAMLTTRDGGSWIRFDTTAVISVRRGAAPGSEEVRVIGPAR